MAQIRLLLLPLLALTAVTAYPHGGGVDKNGGHNDRKTGQYHTHREPSTSRPDNTNPRSSESTHQERGASQSTIDSRIGDYFRAANAGVVYYEGGSTKRDVSASQRERVLRRDGNQCVICGSTLNLEVDHKRALMNGGDNSLSNLATLCNDCHVIKTRMDNSLRRKREE
jgi:5-methylcytosine-specific restriction endonuclease McrA